MPVDAGAGSVARPPPAPPAVPRGWAGAAQERLAALHCIIQRTIDHADLPARPGRRPPPTAPARRAVSEAPPAGDKAEVNRNGVLDYMRCVEQLLLAQFEDTGRKDIMLEYAESYAELSLSLVKKLSDRRAALHYFTPAAAAPDGESNRDIVQKVTRLTRDETSDRQSLSFEEISLRCDMLHSFSASRYSRMQDTLNGVTDAFDINTPPHENTKGTEKQQLRWEAEEGDEVSSAQIVAQHEDVSPPAESSENVVVPMIPLAGKDVPRLFSSGSSPSATLCTTKFPVKFSLTSYPVFSGNMYRSNVPHVMWQLRLFHFENGILRFTTVPTCNCSASKNHWWTVLSAGELTHIATENSEGAIGEPNPPLGRSVSCCFSIYYRKRSESATRRLRCCCATQNEVMLWVFALRHAMQVVQRIESGRLES